MSHLPLLRENIKQSLLKGDYISWFFKYLDFMDESIQDNLDSNKLAEPYLDDINEMFKNDQENYNKKMSAYLKSDSYKKLDELYKKHTEKSNTNNN